MNRPPAHSPAHTPAPQRPAPASRRPSPRQRWALAWLGGALAPALMLGALSPLLRPPAVAHTPPAPLRGALLAEQAPARPAPAAALLAPPRAPAPAAHAARPNLPPAPAPIPTPPPLAAPAAAAVSAAPVATPAQPVAAAASTASGITGAAATSASAGAEKTASRSGPALEALPLRQRCPEQHAPEFPPRALDDDIRAGRVLARLQLDAQGAVREVTILEAEPRGYFEAATRRAALLWRCLPDNEGGASVRVPFIFRAAS